MVKNFRNLFFKNIETKQTLFKNTFWLIIAEAISRFLQLALFVYTARILGVTGYGKFALALSFVSVVVIFSDLGLIDITTREFAREKGAEKEYPAVLSLKIILSVGTLILIWIGSFFISPDPVIQKAIWILAIFILISSFLNIIYAFLRARQKMEYEAATRIIQSILMVGLGFFVLFMAPSVKNLSYAYLFANLIILTFVLLFFHFTFQFLRLNYNRSVWRKFLRLSWPLSLGFIMGWIYVSIDSIMMGCFGQIDQVGWYNAAYRIIVAIVVSATLISRSFYPVLSKFINKSKEKFQEIWNYQMKIMIALAVPITIGGLVLAPKIINLFYGSNYGPSVLAFQCLIFICFIDFLYIPYAMALVVSNQQKKNFGLLLSGFLINIVLNLILIPSYGFYGAAIATIIATTIIFISAGFFLKRFTPVSPFNLKLFIILIISVIAGTAMFIAIRLLLIYNFNLFFMVILAGLVYFFALFFLHKLLNNILELRNAIFV